MSLHLNIHVGLSVCLQEHLEIHNLQSKRESNNYDIALTTCCRTYLWIVFTCVVAKQIDSK